ncbi:MAG: alpha/beta hydrolase [Cellvibrionaceae bacterium]|nr:alpha/beta hydrolase [Cellvibrionaceae bacterium]
MLSNNWITKRQKFAAHQRSTKDHMPNSSDHYYLGLSTEGFHRLYYRHWGSPDSEQTIICVHGLTRISHDFDVLAKKLSKTYRIICPDIAGRGNSDWFGNRETYNIAQYCADINTLIAHLNVDKVHFIGTSMGGIIGMILSAMAHTPIESLILNDVGPDIKRRELQNMGQYVGNAPIFENKQALYEYFKEIYAGSCSLLDERQWKNVAKYSAFKTSNGYRMHYDPKIGEAFRKNYSFFNFDLWKYWHEIECPVMIIRGADSSFLQQDVAEKMSETLDDVRLVEIAGAGHTPPLRTEKEINIVSAFLKEMIQRY